MCIIIAKRAGVAPVPREYLERAWETINYYKCDIIQYIRIKKREWTQKNL